MVHIYIRPMILHIPLSRNRDGTYKIQSGEKIRVCMTSDFCLEEADIWRDDVWFHD